MFQCQKKRNKQQISVKIICFLSEGFGVLSILALWGIVRYGNIGLEAALAAVSEHMIVKFAKMLSVDWEHESFFLSFSFFLFVFVLQQ